MPRLASSCLDALQIKDLFRQMLTRSTGSRHPQGNPQPMGRKPMDECWDPPPVPQAGILGNVLPSSEVL